MNLHLRSLYYTFKEHISAEKRPGSWQHAQPGVRQQLLAVPLRIPFSARAGPKRRRSPPPFRDRLSSCHPQTGPQPSAGVRPSFLLRADPHHLRAGRLAEPLPPCPPAPTGRASPCPLSRLARPGPVGCFAVKAQPPPLPPCPCGTRSLVTEGGTTGSGRGTGPAAQARQLGGAHPLRQRQAAARPGPQAWLQLPWRRRSPSRDPGRPRPPAPVAMATASPSHSSPHTPLPVHSCSGCASPVT